MAPTILVVPGSFSPPTLYDNVISHLHSLGHTSARVLSLPTVLDTSKRRPAASMYDDASHIAAEVRKALEEQGGNVILVSHSYGGTPASQSTKGLSIKERLAEGLNGGIVRLVYLTAIIPELNTSRQPRSNPGSRLLEAIEVEDDYLVFRKPELAAPDVFSDIDHDAGVKLMAKFEGHSLASTLEPLTWAGYRDIPSSYIFCTEDKCIVPDEQKDYVSVLKQNAPEGSDVEVIDIPTGHAPNVSKPELVAKTIAKIAESA